MPSLAAFRLVACASSGSQVACSLPITPLRWPPVRCVAELDFGGGRKEDRHPMHGMVSCPQAHLCTGQSRGDAGSHKTTRGVDRPEVPQCHNPEGGTLCFPEHCGG